MSKLASGLTLLFGLCSVGIGAAISATANAAQSTPDTDFFYNSLNSVGVIVTVVGLGTFFFGAMKFAQK